MLLFGDGYASDDSGDGPDAQPSPEQLIPTYAAVDTVGVQSTPLACIANRLHRKWSVTSTSGKYCAVLTQQFIGHMTNTIMGGVTAQSPGAILDLFHNSDSILLACKTSSADSGATPGRGYCGLTAARIVKHHDAERGYSQPSLDDPQYCTALTSSIGSIQGAISFTKRSHRNEEDKALCSSLAARLKTMSTGLAPKKGNKSRGPAIIDSSEYMQSVEFIMLSRIWQLRMMLWIAIPGTNQSRLTPFRNDWAMASDTVDVAHELISGAATPSQLITAATLPHQVILHEYHYYVHRGISPREEVAQCIAELERMIIAELEKMIITALLDTGSPVEPPQPVLASPTPIDLTIPSVQPLPLDISGNSDPSHIHQVRSGNTMLGISNASIAKMQGAWVRSQQPGISDWVDTYIMTKGCLQITTPLKSLDASYIPGKGYCAYLVIYWTYMRDVEKLRPELIKARVHLASRDNKIRLSNFLLKMADLLAEQPISTMLDPIIQGRLAYTADRLRHTHTDTMLDEVGVSNWLSTGHIQRLVATFSTVHQWSTTLANANQLMLLTTNKTRVGTSNRCDEWRGSDIERLHSTPDAHIFYSIEGMHFSVMSGPPKGPDIINCYVCIARLLKEILRGNTLVEWPSSDLNNLSFPPRVCPPRRIPKSKTSTHIQPSSSSTSNKLVPPRDIDSDDDPLDEDYNPDPSPKSKPKSHKKTASGASRRQKSSEKNKGQALGRNAKGASRKIGMSPKVGGSRSKRVAPRIAIPVQAIPSVAAVLADTVAQVYQMPKRIRKPPDKYSGIPPAVQAAHQQGQYYPDVSPPPAPHYDTNWDDSAKDYMFIAPSRLHGAGQGGFAARAIAAKVTIGLYKGGEHLKLRDVLRASYKSDYVWTDESKGIVRDAQDPQSCATRFINDAIDGKKDNCQFQIINNQVCLVTLRKIAENEELYASYGEVYWRHSRWSSAILEQARMVHEKAASKVIWKDLIKYKRWDEKYPNTPYISERRALPDSESIPLDDVHIQESVMKWSTKSKPVNLKIGTWNVNGQTARAGLGGLSKIIDFYQHAGLDILYLTDTRLTSHQADRVAKIIKTALPGHAVVRFPSTLYPGRIAGGSQLAMGGLLAIVSSQWEPYIANKQIDGSGLGLVGKITLSYNKGLNKIDIIGAYLPPRPGSNPGPLTIWSRLTSFLAKSSQKISPRAYTEKVIERWMAKSAEAHRQVFLCGDMNGVLESRCSQRDIRHWINSLNLSSPHMTYLRPEVEYHTFFHKDKGISRIDHVLHTPLPPDQSVVEVGMDNDVSMVRYFDHRPIWIGLHIAHVHSIKTRPPPAMNRPIPVEIPRHECPKRAEFIQLTDDNRIAKLDDLPNVTDMSAEQKSCALAALLHITIASASAACGIVTKNRIHRLCRKKRSSYKDGYSPIMRIIQESMHFFIRIRRLVVAKRKTHRWSKDNYYATLLQHINPWKRRVQKFLEPCQDINRVGLKLANPAFLLAADFNQISSRVLSEKITTLRKMLQGRFRKELRANVSAAVKRLEDLRLANKIGLMIRRLGDKERFMLDLFSMNDPVLGRITNPITIHENLTDANEEIYNVPTNLDPSAEFLQDDRSCWTNLLEGLDPDGCDDEEDTIHPESKIPAALQRKLKDVCRIKAAAPMMEEMEKAMSDPISFEVFEAAINSLKSDKAPGPSMVTPNMIKAWSHDTLHYAYELINGLWEAKHIPKWWSDHILCPAPKKSNDPVMDNIRPIGLFEVIRKVWTGIIGARIHTVWDSHNILHHAQHGFRWRQGTDTAILKLINALEGTREGELPRFCTLWDVRKAFDSVPRNLLRLAWARLGVPPGIVRWLTGLDEDGLTFVKSPHMSNRLEPRTFQDIKTQDGHFIAREDLGFKAIRGIGQGDNLSTLSWIALFDILLCLCEDESIAYADDLINTCDTTADIQIKADKVSAFCAFTGLEIAATKILAVLINSDADTDTEGVPPQLIVRDWHWNPMEVPFDDARSSMKYLGVDIATTEKDEDSFTWCHNAVTRQLRHLTSRRATSECKLKLIQSQILPTILYRASKACWPLAKYHSLDKLFSAAFRIILRLNVGFPAELLYAPPEFAGLNLPRFSDLAQLQKWGSIHRACNLTGEPRRAATELLERVQNDDTSGTCYFGTSLAEWGRAGGLELHNMAPAIPEHRLAERIDIPRLQTLLRLGPDQPDNDWDGGAKVFTDGSFTTTGLSPYSILDTQWNVRRKGIGGAGMIWLGDRYDWRQQRPRMLRIISDESPTMGLNSYAYELLGITIASQMSEHVPSHVPMVSDCKGAVSRIDESMKLHHRALGHHAKGVFCESVLRAHNDEREARQIAWTRSHPEERYPEDFWSYEDWGIWLADAIAEGDRTKIDNIFGQDQYDWEEVTVTQILDSVITDGLWHWRTNDEYATVVTDDIMHHIHPIRIQEYLRTRDGYRFKRGIMDAYWTDTAPQLPAQCAPKPKNIYASIQICKRVWDKWATGRQMAKGKKGPEALMIGACPLCGDPDSQKHMFVECKHCQMASLREKAFDSQATCLLQLQRDGAFQNGMQWMQLRAKRMMHLANGFKPNGTPTPDVERLWLGTFTPDTLIMILMEDVHKEDLSSSQYAQYCKIITELTKIRSLVAEEMINVRYQLYNAAKKKDRNIKKRLPPQKKTSGTRRQRMNAPLGSNQKLIDAMFQPKRRSRRSIRRQVRYRLLQQKVREARSRRNLGVAPPEPQSQSRILILPARHSPGCSPMFSPPLEASPPDSIREGNIDIHRSPVFSPPLEASPPDSIRGGNIDIHIRPTHPTARMIAVKFNDYVSHPNIDLDRRRPQCTHTVDKSPGLNTRDVCAPERHRDG
jgi:exonuclease III